MSRLSEKLKIIVDNLKCRTLAKIIDLYAEPTMPRNLAFSVVRSEIENIHALISDLEEIIPELEALKNMIKLILKCDFIASEYMLMKYLIQEQIYVDFQKITLRKTNEAVDSGQSMKIKNNEDIFVYLPACQTLTLIFNKTNLLDKILERQSELKNNEIENLIQAEIWQDMISNIVVKENQLILPLIIFYDDLQVLNPMGTQVIDYKVGVILLKIGILPRELESKLNAIIPHTLFFANDRKEFGNDNILRHLVMELSHLATVGIKIHHPTVTSVIFVPTLLIGDNEAMNGLADFLTNFGKAKMICRDCKCIREHFGSK